MKDLYKKMKTFSENVDKERYDSDRHYREFIVSLGIAMFHAEVLLGIRECSY